jgi:hypothetical protein
MHVQVNEEYVMMVVQEIITPILEFVGNKIADYHSYGHLWTDNGEWAESNHSHGILKYPEKHTTQIADVTLGLIAVAKWRRCTGFVVLQNSDRGVSVHFFLSDKVMHDAASFGTSCNSAFGSYRNSVAK